MVKKLKIETDAGELIDFSVSKMRELLMGVGFTGKLLLKATASLLKEISKMTKKEVITATDLEKAVVKAISSTNDIAMNTAQKMTKKILR